MSWADRAKSCIGWDERDAEGLASLWEWLAPEKDELVDLLVEGVTQLDGVPRLLRNGRFTGRLHALVEEWLLGVLAPAYDDVERQERRRDLGRRLARIDVCFEEVMLLEAMAHGRLLALISKNQDGGADQLSLMLGALQKALSYDRGLVHAGYVEFRDSEMEQALLDRFLSITGFSPSLYEGLAETWEQERGRDRRP